MMYSFIDYSNDVGGGAFYEGIDLIPVQCDYRRLAELHRPTDDNGLAENVRDLAAQGLLPGDISRVLGLSTDEVRRLLTARGGEAAALHAAAWTDPNHAGGAGNGERK